MLALVDDVGENFNWGPNQYIGFWKLGDVSTQSKVEITTDSQLLDWLDKGNQHGVVNIHAIVNDFGGPLQVEPSPTKRRCHPSVRYSIPCTPPLFTDLLVDATPLTLPESYNHLENSIQPVPSTQNESTTHPESTSHPDDEATSPIKKSAKKVVKKCAKRRSQDDDDDEEVWDDEKEENEEEEPQLCPNCDPLEVDSDSSYDSDAAASSDSEYDCDDLDDQIHDDDDNDSDLEHVFAYDFDNPCIDEGEVFADTTTCKEAVTHHAIIHDYSFETEKKDKQSVVEMTTAYVERRGLIGDLFYQMAMEGLWLYMHLSKQHGYIPEVLLLDGFGIKQLIAGNHLYYYFIDGGFALIMKIFYLSQ